MAYVSDSQLLSLSPHDPADSLGNFPITTNEEMIEIVRNSRSAYQQWSQDPMRRAAALRSAASALREQRDEFVKLIAMEVGKPISEAGGEVDRAVSILEYYSTMTLHAQGETLPSNGASLLFTSRAPYGIAGLITPWNFPLAIPIWKAAPALAAGNTVLIKPSEYSTATTKKMLDVFSSAIPAGVISLVVGSAQQGTQTILSSDVVSFTGSVLTGRKVIDLATQQHLPVQAEMGGCNPAIILEDADKDHAVSQLVIAAFSYSGQKCTATRKIIVVGDQKRADSITQTLSAAMQNLVIGDPLSESTYIGPLINESAQIDFNSAVARAITDGASVISSDKPLPNIGWYVKPTLTVGIKLDSDLLREETFGPLVHIVTAPNIESAIELANDSQFGLTASIHTANLEQAFRIASKLETGIVKVNAPTAGVDYYAPFGGAKNSSFGPREQGTAAMDFYTYTRTLFISPRG